MSKLTELEQVIGYEFNEQRLLQQALTHSSFANEKHMKKLSDNERLEFLGDAVLEVVSSEFLYKEHTDLPEGDLTKLRASIVCEPTLALCTREIDLGKYLYLVDGEIDCFRLMLVYGVPVGIPYMFFIIPARWDLSGTIGMVALCAIIGAVFGFIIAIGIAIRAVWYVIAFPISCLLRKEKSRI